MPSNQHLHCPNTPFNSFLSPLNNAQASLSLRNNSPFSLLPSLCLYKSLWGWLFLVQSSLSEWPYRQVTRHLQRGLPGWSTVSQGRAELLPCTFTRKTQHILTGLLSPSAFGKFPGRVCVYISKTDSKHHLQGFKQASKHIPALSSGGSVGGLPVNLLLHFVLLLIAEGLWFPFRSSHKPFCYFFPKFLPGPWRRRGPCMIMSVVFRIPYLWRFFLR